MELLFETWSDGGWRPLTRSTERPAAAARESCASAQASGVSSELIWAVSRTGATGLSIVRRVTTVYVRSGVGGLSLRARTGALPRALGSSGWGRRLCEKVSVPLGSISDCAPPDKRFLSKTGPKAYSHQRENQLSLLLNAE